MLKRILKFGGLSMAIIFLLLQFTNVNKPRVLTPTPHSTPTVLTTMGPGYLVVDLVDGATENDLEAIERKINADMDWVYREADDEGIATGYVAHLEQALIAIEGHPLVEAAEAEQRFTHTGFVTNVEVNFGTSPNDPMYDKQWHLKAMGAPYGWANTPKGRGIIVAVLDTGVTKTKDLAGTNVLEGKGFTGEGVEDGHGHGTHVAGTIAQTTNNGVMVAGVAPEATILPVKVLTNAGFGSVGGIAEGINWAADNGAHIINMSLGGGYSPVIHNAVKKARTRGVLVFAACGNSGTNACGYPGGLKEAIGVSATGPDKKLSPYSDHGKGVDLAAPGGNKMLSGGGIFQNTIMHGRDAVYDFQGTSMAAPHAAGAAAVLWSTDTNADADWIERTLLETADGDEWTEEFGHGQLNLQAALSSSTGSFLKTETAVLGLSSLAFGGLIAWLSGWVSRRFSVIVPLTASTVAAGMWWFSFLPLPEHLVFKVLSSPVLAWPEFFYTGASSFPLWLSAAPAAALAYVFGVHKYWRPLVTGLLVGIGTHLLWGFVAGTLTPSFLGLFGPVWLMANAGVCAFLAMGLAGVEKSDR